MSVILKTETYKYKLKTTLSVLKNLVHTNKFNNCTSISIYLILK